MTNPPVILIPFLIAFISTAIVTPLLIPLIKKLGYVDDPTIHRHPAMLHTKPIPRAGGISLFLGVFIGAIFSLSFDRTTISIFIASFLALVIGTIDDKYDVSRYLRFGINILCALIVVSAGIGIPFVTNPFGGILHLDFLKITFSFFGIHTIYPISDFLALLWIVWAMNMLNWSKGVDGQMPGIVIISALTIGILSLRFPMSDSSILTDAVLAFIIAGCMLGFLLYNFHPAKIFPGYGATSIYLLLAIVSILSSSKLATAILVMGIPTVDALFTIVRRMIQKKNPFFGDNKHLHHLLLDLGYTQRQIALFYWCISAILGLVSLTLESKSKLFAIIMVGIITGGGLLFLHLMARYSNEKDTT